jgi:hypothetical protein
MDRIAMERLELSTEEPCEESESVRTPKGSICVDFPKGPMGLVFEPVIKSSERELGTIKVAVKVLESLYSMNDYIDKTNIICILHLSRLYGARLLLWYWS